TRDPYNVLLARGPRFRVDAEIVRDIALAASGLLNVKVGGPSVFPPAPAFLFTPPASYGPKAWKESTDADRYRRALYTFRYRSVARTPTEREASQLLALLNKQTQRFAGGKLNPWDLAAANPEHPPAQPKGATPAQLAAWTAVSRVILNLDETITKE